MGQYVKIKIIVDGAVFYFSHLTKDGTVYMEQKKQKAIAVLRTECQDLFPAIREFFEKHEKNIELEIVRA